MMLGTDYVELLATHRPAKPRNRRELAEMTALLENSTIDIKNRSHTVTAQIEVPQAGAEDVILAQGGSLRRLELLRKGWKAQVLL